jgi:hypothetical protein
VPKRVSPELEREIRRLAARGHGLREIGRLVHRSHHAVTNALAREPSSTPMVWNPSPARLSLAQREEIRVGIERGDTFTAIAKLIGRAVSTVSREVAANGGRNAYQGWHAHQQAGCRARRPKTPKLAHPPLVGRVTELLEEWWSPEEISLWLRIEFPDDPMMWVSHETIYQSLFVQGRGELRRELIAACGLVAPTAGLAAGSRTEAGCRAWSTSVHARPRSKIGPCPAIGRATSSSAKIRARRWGPWWSAPPAMSCCCTFPTVAAPSRSTKP